MTEYVIFFIIVFFFSLAFEKKPGNGVLFIIIFALWLLIGLRDIGVGVDTHGYIEEFHQFRQMNLSSLWTQLKSTSEPLYIFLSWLIGQFSSNYTVFLLWWAILPAISIFISLKDYTEGDIDWSVSIVVFFLLGFFAFYVAGIRQAAALSLVLLSLKYIDKSKFWRFFVIIIIASLIHNSAILFLVAYLLRKIKIRWWYILIAILLFVLTSYIQVDYITTLSQYLFHERFANYGVTYESTQNSSAFIMQTILFTVCLIKYKDLCKENELNNILFIFSFLGLLIQSMSGMIAEMARVSFYFCIFDLILVPRALRSYSANIRQAFYVVFFLGSLSYLFFLSSSNLPEYSLALM